MIYRRKNESVDEKSSRRFVISHIEDVEKILKRLEAVNLILSAEKSSFGIHEILMIGHLCRDIERKSNLEKVDVIERIKNYKSIIEVRTFLGACVFNLIWIPHYAHLAEPMNKLLIKGVKFNWRDEQIKATESLKKVLITSLVLKMVDYDCGRSIIITVDTSPIVTVEAVD